MAKRRRNIKVQEAVELTLSRIDSFIDGDELSLPSPSLRHACEELISSKSASVLTASLFLNFYKIVDDSYDFERVPIGARGKYGDKLLCEELTKRSLTLHNNITAPFENIGSKGGVDKFTPINDSRFSKYLQKLYSSNIYEIKKAADYLAQRFAESQRLIQPLPPVGKDILTFARAKKLFFKILDIPSEGFIQQFLVSALLVEFRRKQNIDVKTHHPHASDTFDQTAGDIEEFSDDILHRAYEVTVRDDWKNRISAFKNKMDKHRLSKYIIIASGINEDHHWSEPAELALRLDSYGRDIAVIDIRDVTNFLAADLGAKELRDAVNTVYKYLSNQKLCGRHDLMDKYRDCVNEWLDQF